MCWNLLLARPGEAEGKGERAGKVYASTVANACEAVEALVGVGKEASSWLVQNLNGNIPQGMTTPVTIQMMPPDLQCLGLLLPFDVCWNTGRCSPSAPGSEVRVAACLCVGIPLYLRERKEPMPDQASLLNLEYDLDPE